MFLGPGHCESNSAMLNLKQEAKGLEKGKMTMKQVKGTSIGVLVVCVVMLLPQSVFAGEVKPFELEPGSGTIATKPFIPDNGTDGSDQISSSNVVPPAKQPLMDFGMGTSSLSLPDNKPGEIPQTLTEEESATVLVRMDELISMVLVSLRAQRESISEKSGEAYNALNNEIKKYEEAQIFLDAFFEANGKPGRTTAYETLKNVGDLLSPGLPNSKQTQGKDLPENLIRQLASYALQSVQGVRERIMADASLPEARIFSAEVSSGATHETRLIQREEKSVLSGKADRTSQDHYQMPDSVLSNRETTEVDKLLDSSSKQSPSVRKEHSALSGKEPSVSQSNYQVLGSVVPNPEMAKVYALLNPPQKLHPFIRWLFYGRHLTQVRAERYLAARAKVKEICMRAKAGEGLIRYKGKIMEMFLPLPGDEGGGTFELVRRM